MPRELLLDPVESWRAARDGALEVWRERIKPPPTLTVSAWADLHRILPDTSAEPGPWRTLRTPYLMGIMNACSDGETERVVVMKGAQVGYSEALLNTLGYFVDQDPAPILLVLISSGEAEKFSKERVSKLFNETPRLYGKVSAPKSRDSANTIESKSFAGGHLGIVGANAPAGLRSRPRRVVLLDEVDGYPPSAGEEGDPVELAIKRTTTYWNRLIVMGSTPTVAEMSRIDVEYRSTDQRQFLVPCPHCSHLQALAWLRIRWEKRMEGARKIHLPDTACFVCEKCGAEIGESEKPWMLEEALNFGIDGWHPTAEGRPRTAGFHLPSTLSPWLSWAEMAEDFLDAKKKGPLKLQVFVNTRLAEVWDEKGSTLDETSLIGRREEYPASPLPKGAALLTMGVDVQADRLEAEIVGWGVGEESWSIEYLRIPGDPTVEKVWDDLDQVLARSWDHPSGVRLFLSATCVDSGYMTQQVKKFTKDRLNQNVWAVKGLDGFGRPIMDRPSNKNRGKVPLYPVGVDTAKSVLYGRLQGIERPPGWAGEPLPGYCHFPLRVPYDEEYFKQLAAEKVVVRALPNGQHVRRWVRRPEHRAEALDCRVYAMAALDGLILAGVRLDELAARLSEPDEDETAAPEPEGNWATRITSRRGPWVGR